MAWETAYYEWEKFEKEVEIDMKMEALRKICFEMQTAAMLTRFNQNKI